MRFFFVFNLRDTVFNLRGCVFGGWDRDFGDRDRDFGGWDRDFGDRDRDFGGWDRDRDRDFGGWGRGWVIFHHAISWSVESSPCCITHKHFNRRLYCCSKLFCHEFPKTSFQFFFKCL
jgi:hypothetical protein